MTFSQVTIGQTFYTSNGQPSIKISETRLRSLVPHYTGIDYQEAILGVEMPYQGSKRVYGIGEPKEI